MCLVGLICKGHFHCTDIFVNACLVTRGNHCTVHTLSSTGQNSSENPVLIFVEIHSSHREMAQCLIGPERYCQTLDHATYDLHLLSHRIYSGNPENILII